MKKIILYAATLELLYLSLSFVIAQKYGQWSYEGELLRTVLRIISILGFSYFYRTYFYSTSEPTRLKEEFVPQLIVPLMLLFLFAIVYTNAEHETITWQLIFAFSGIAAGFREELFYRGIVQNSLQRKYHYRTALLVTCILFTLSHIQYIYHGQTMAVMLISLAGIIFGSIFFYTGSVFFVGSIHGIYDALLCINISPVRLSNAAGLPILLLITLLFLIITYKKTMGFGQTNRRDSDNNNTLSSY